MFLWLTLLTGVAYPLLITLLAQLTMRHQAQGSFLTVNDKVIGSELIGQEFKSEKYFWGRPSAHAYDPLQSGGSNYGPTNKDLKKLIEDRRKIILSSHSIDDPRLIPSELLYASGSGLDPHISPSTAYFQAERVARARDIEKEKVEALIKKSTERRGLGFLGEPVVNVLKLNSDLDSISP